MVANIRPVTRFFGFDIEGLRIIDFALAIVGLVLVIKSIWTLWGHTTALILTGEGIEVHLGFKHPRKMPWSTIRGIEHNKTEDDEVLRFKLSEEGTRLMHLTEQASSFEYEDGSVGLVSPYELACSLLAEDGQDLYTELNGILAGLLSKQGA